MCSIAYMYLKLGDIYYCRLNDVTATPCIKLCTENTEHASDMFRTFLSTESNTWGESDAIQSTIVNVA